MLFSTTPGGRDLDGFQYWTVEQGWNTKLHNIQIPRHWTRSQKVESQRKRQGGLISTSCGRRADIFNFESNF